MPAGVYDTYTRLGGMITSAVQCAQYHRIVKAVSLFELLTSTQVRLV